MEATHLVGTAFVVEALLGRERGVLEVLDDRFGADPIGQAPVLRGHHVELLAQGVLEAQVGQAAPEVVNAFEVVECVAVVAAFLVGTAVVDEHVLWIVCPEVAESAVHPALVVLGEATVVPLGPFLLPLAAFTHLKVL